MAPTRKRAARPRCLTAVGAAAAIAFVASAAVATAVGFALPSSADAGRLHAVAGAAAHGARSAPAAGAAAGAAAARASQAGALSLNAAETDDAPSAEAIEQTPLWLDFRKARMTDPAQALFRGTPEDLPDIKETLKKLVVETKAKLSLIGMPPPEGNIFDGILVDEGAEVEVAEQVKAFGFRVYVVARDIDGIRLGENAIFVCDTETKLPVGALTPPKVQLTSLTRKMPIAVQMIVPQEEPDEETAAAARAEEAKKMEEMKRYQEGLKDASKYVLPPKERLKVLYGRGGLAQEGETLKVKLGDTLATTMPPDALLWARAMVQRMKESGKSLPKYEIKSDRDAATSSKHGSLKKTFGQ